jgi:hypothetical protein
MAAVVAKPRVVEGFFMRQGVRSDEAMRVFLRMHTFVHNFLCDAVGHHEDTNLALVEVGS